MDDLHLSLSHAGAAAAPANDLFANRAALTGGSGSVSRSNLGATIEPGEPRHAGIAGGASLWWTWTAPAAGTLTLSTSGSAFDTLLAVYVGDSLISLSPVVSNDQDPFGGSSSRVVFEVYPGVAYQIAVDGKNFAGGNATLAYAFEAAPPPTDLFEDFLARHFTAGQLSDLNIAGPGADPDGDGLPNLLEYAFAFDPLVINREGRPTVATVGGRLTLSFIRRTDTPDIAYIPEVSGTLATWGSGAGNVEEISVETIGENLQRVTVRDASTEGGARRFIRLRIQL